MQSATVISQGRTHVVQFIETPTDLVPVPVEPFEAGYKPQGQYLVDDACFYRVGARRWRMRFTGAHNVDSWTDHRTLREARQHFCHRTGLRLPAAA